MGDLILTRNVVPGGASNVLADTALVRSVGVFDDSFMTLADWVLWTRLGLAAPLATVDRPLHGYYVHAGSMAHDVRRTEWELRLLGRKSADTRRQRSVALDWAQMRQYLGAWALRQGDRRAAARLHCQLALSREDRPLRSVSACLVGVLWPGVQNVRDNRASRRCRPSGEPRWRSGWSRCGSWTAVRSRACGRGGPRRSNGAPATQISHDRCGARKDRTQRPTRSMDGQGRRGRGAGGVWLRGPSP